MRERNSNIRNMLDRLSRPADHWRKEEERFDQAFQELEREKSKKNRLMKETEQAIEIFMQNKTECINIYSEVGARYEEAFILKDAFSGDGSITYYMNYYLSVCGREGLGQEEKETMELLLYKNILAVIKLKLDEVETKLQGVGAYDEKSFGSYYEMNLDSGELRLLPAEKRTDDRKKVYRDYTELKKEIIQLKKVRQKLEQLLRQYQEDSERLCRISEEWKNRGKFLRTSHWEDLQYLYRKLSKFRWEDYALKEDEDAENYKARLLELADEFRGLMSVFISEPAL